VQYARHYDVGVNDLAPQQCTSHSRISRVTVMREMAA
jgi:hypothetical protein